MSHLLRDTDSMVHGDPPFLHHGHPGDSSSNSSPLEDGAGNCSSGNMNSVVQVQGRELGARDETRILPVSNVMRIMRQILPADAEISDECRERVIECATDFIYFITVEANHQCQLDRRRKLTAEDLINAMRRLSFDNYVEVLTRFLHRYRHNNINNTTDAHAPPPVAQQHLPAQPAIAFPATYDDAVPVPLPPVAPPFFPVDPNLFSDDESSGGSNSGSVSFDPIAYLNHDNFCDDK